MKKFSEWKVRDYDMLCCYTSVEMIDLITDTNKWYYTDRKIEPEEILEFAILENGEWNAYSLSEMQCAEGIE